MSKKHLLNQYSGGINYPDKINEYINFIKKLDTIIDYIYCLDDLFYYFNFDTEKEKCIKNLDLNFCDIGIKLEIIRAFCIDELTYKDKLVQLLKKEESRYYIGDKKEETKNNKEILGGNDE